MTILCTISYIAYLILFVVYLCVGLYIRRTKDKKLFIISMVMTAISFILSFMSFATFMIIGNGKMVYYIPPLWICVLLSGILICFFTGLLIFIILKCQKTNTENTAFALLYGINYLNTGLCCYLDNGKTIMVNEKMEQLSFEAYGNYLFNGNDFNDFLIQHLDEKNEIRIGERYYFYSFRKFCMRKMNVNEINLTDISDEHQMNERLNEETKRRYEYQKKMKQYSENMLELVRKEEILNTKIKVHAELGNLLLLGKYSIKNENERLYFIQQSENISSLLLTKDKEENSFSELLSIAKSIGISVHIQGTVEEEHKEAVIRLIQESITNCRKHTDGRNLYLDIEKNNEETKYICYNDGRQPETKITEGGGLSAVRKITEKANGEMNYNYDDGFKIILSFGKDK